MYNKKDYEKRNKKYKCNMCGMLKPQNEFDTDKFDAYSDDNVCSECLHPITFIKCEICGELKPEHRFKLAKDGKYHECIWCKKHRWIEPFETKPMVILITIILFCVNFLFITDKIYNGDMEIFLISSVAFALIEMALITIIISEWLYSGERW